MAAAAPLLRESERFGYLKPKDVARLEDAYRFSEAAHAGQTRQSGEPYISHPLAVAEILADWHLDGQTLMAALLHDVTEDTSVTSCSSAAISVWPSRCQSARISATASGCEM